MKKLFFCSVLALWCAELRAGDDVRYGIIPKPRFASGSGLYYGIQTVCQLLPVQIYGEKKAPGVRWNVPCCEIDDAPRFPYRGLMLDAGRYFMPKELVLKFIDVMSMHKQNYFHWHLTED